MDFCISNPEVQQPRASSDLGSLKLQNDSCLGLHLEAAIQRIFTDLPKACPELTGMFRSKERNKNPPPSLDAWAGGYIGTLLTVASQLYRLTKDDKLKANVESVVTELCSSQSQFGYLGPWPETHQFKKDAPNCEIPWDAWGHHRVLVGANSWSKSAKSHKAAMLFPPISDQLMQKFGMDASALHSLGGHTASAALVDSFATMHLETDEEKYLLAAKTMIKFMALPGCGDLVKLAAAKKPFSGAQDARWELLSAVEGFAKLGQLGDPDFEVLGSTAAHIWWSLCETSRCSNGGLRLGDQSVPSPLPTSSARTTATGAWAALTAEILNLTGRSVVADELELTLYNAGVAAGATSENGVCFEDLPTDGAATESSARLSQAAVSGGLALSSIAECASKVVGNTVVVNLFSAGTFKAQLQNGNQIAIKQDTKYPHGTDIDFGITSSRRSESFTICIRIPAWATNAEIEIELSTANQPEKHSPEPGQYFCVEKPWCSGDRISLNLNTGLSFRQVDSSRGVHVYYGPLLMAVDRSGLSSSVSSKIDEFSMADAVACITSTSTKTSVVFEVDGKQCISMCDYANASQLSPMNTTVHLTDSISPVSFSRDAPLRTFIIKVGTKSAEQDSQIDNGSISKGKNKKAARVAVRLESQRKSKHMLAQGRPKSVVKAKWKFFTLGRKKKEKTPETDQSAKPTTQSTSEAPHDVSNTTQSSANNSGTSQDVEESSAPPEPPLQISDQSTTVAQDVPPNHPDYQDPSQTVNPAEAPEEADLKELFEAKAMQEKLRKIKTDMETKAAAVAGKVPGAQPSDENDSSRKLSVAHSEPKTEVAALERKTSTRDMLKSVSVIHDTFAPPETQGPSSDTAGNAAPTDDYDIATAEEQSTEPSAPDAGGPKYDNKVGAHPPSAWKENPDGIGQQSSSKRSWKNLFKKSAHKKEKVKTKENTTKNPFGAKSKAKASIRNLPSSQKCFFCDKAVFSMEKGEADGMVFHKTCFRCAHCNKVVKIGSYAALEGKIYCKPHFKQLFMSKGNYNEGFGTEQHKHKWVRKDGADTGNDTSTGSNGGDDAKE